MHGRLSTHNGFSKNTVVHLRLVLRTKQTNGLEGGTNQNSHRMLRLLASTMEVRILGLDGPPRQGSTYITEVDHTSFVKMCCLALQ